jgi:hypothetical protein
MSEMKSADREITRVVRSWLSEDRHEDVSRVAGAVLDELDATPQRRTTWWPARRTPIMNRIVGFGLAAAAVVVAVFIGLQLLDGPNVGGPDVEPSQSAAPSESAPLAEPSAWVGVPAGAFLWFDPTNPSHPLLDGPPITITVAASGWTLPGWEGLIKGDQVDNVPESWLLYASTTAGILVYGDPCQWAASTPSTPATTADQVVAALAAQASRSASDPVNVTLGGYPGKMVTLHVPDDAVFSECEGGAFATYEVQGQNGVPWRLHQGPGQIDEFWVVDVDGAIVIIDAAYRPDTSTERIDEMHTMIESASFN